MKITQGEMDLLTELASSFDGMAYDPEKHVLLADLSTRWGIKRGSARGRMDKMIENGAPWKCVRVLDENHKWNTAYEKIE